MTSDLQVQFEQQRELVERARALGIEVADHLCGCERCTMTSELCPATLDSLEAACRQALRGGVIP